MRQQLAWCPCLNILVNQNRPAMIPPALYLVLISQKIASKPRPDATIGQNGVLPVKQTFVTTRLWIVRVVLFSLLAAIMSVGIAQATTVSYILDDIFLNDGTQMTGAFDWTYDIEDFEGGSGVFTALEIPYLPGGSVPPS